MPGYCRETLGIAHRLRRLFRTAVKMSSDASVERSYDVLPKSPFSLYVRGWDREYSFATFADSEQVLVVTQVSCVLTAYSLEHDGRPEPKACL